MCFRYPQRELFAHWCACIPPGLTVVRGGDGCGKSTLLRLLAGKLPAHGGQLEVKGVRLADQPAAYRQQVFWADPRASAFDQITSIDYFHSLRGLYAGFDEPLSGQLSQGLSLAAHLNKPIYMLSAGSKRKVWLVAAFASGAAVTLLDEPFAALDKASIGFVLEVLQDLAGHPDRAWVIAHDDTPGDVALAQVIDLGD